MTALNEQQHPWFVAHKRFSTVGVALCVTIAFWIGLNIVLSGLVSAYFPQGDLPSWVTLLVSSGPLYLVAMPLGVLALGPVPALNTRRFDLGPKRFLAWLIMCVPVMYVGNILGTMLSTLISGGQSTDRVTEILRNGAPIPTFVFAVILAPVFEEWLFRKQLIDRTRRYGEKTAILLSAVAFALFHLNFYQFFYAFGLGLVFGYVYMRTSRMRYSVLMHALINLNGSVVAPWLLSQVDPKLVSGELTEADLMRLAANPPAGLMLAGCYSLLIIGLLIAGVALLCVNLKKLEFYTTPEELPKGTGARTAFGNPGMIVYVVLTLALTVWMML